MIRARRREKRVRERRRPRPLERPVRQGGAREERAPRPLSATCGLARETAVEDDARRSEAAPASGRTTRARKREMPALADRCVTRVVKEMAPCSSTGTAMTLL